VTDVTGLMRTARENTERICEDVLTRVEEAGDAGYGASDALERHALEHLRLTGRITRLVEVQDPAEGRGARFRYYIAG
jgi:hypothetical protein